MNNSLITSLRVRRPAWMLALFLAMLSLGLESCKKDEAGGKPDDVDYYTCTMHPSVRKQNPTDKCPICSMDLVPVKKTGEKATENEQPGTFTVAIERQQQIGVTYGKVQKQPLKKTVRMAGVVTNDKQRHQETGASQEHKVTKEDNSANLSNVWVWAKIYQDDLGMLKINLPVVITSSAYPGEKFSGKISAIDPFLDTVTRAGSMRIDVNTPDSKLRLEMSVDVELTADMGEGLTVPFDAVMPTGKHNVVFVEKGEGRLEPRFIELGAKYGDFFEVKSGLKEGERIVTSANFLIDAEANIQGALKSW